MARSVHPAKIEHVPVTGRLSHVPQSGNKRRGRIRANRTVKACPIVQGISQHAEAADARRFRPHHQRQNTDRLPAVGHHEDAKLLPLGTVLPVAFQPVQRVEEAGPRCLGEQRLPSRAEFPKIFDLADLADFDHGQSEFE
jgi:hypothetical protein